MKKKYACAVYPLITILIVFASCAGMKKDDYPEPEETLKGRIIDKNTGQPIVTEQPNGIRVQLDELSWSDNPVPLFFWVRPDGTYTHTKLFKGTYRIKPVDGAFFPLEEGEIIDIAGITTLDFEVEPFLNIELLDVAQSGNRVDFSYQISRSRKAFKITDARIFVGPTEVVNNSAFYPNMGQTIDLRGTSDEDILNTVYTASVDGLEANRTYFIRVGARTDDNVNKRYNYSGVIEVKVP